MKHRTRAGNNARNIEKHSHNAWALDRKDANVAFPNTFLSSHSLLGTISVKLEVEYTERTFWLTEECLATIEKF